MARRQQRRLDILFVEIGSSPFIGGVQIDLEPPFASLPQALGNSERGQRPAKPVRSLLAVRATIGDEGIIQVFWTCLGEHDLRSEDGANRILQQDQGSNPA